MVLVDQTSFAQVQNPRAIQSALMNANLDGAGDLPKLHIPSTKKKALRLLLYMLPGFISKV